MRVLTVTLLLLALPAPALAADPSIEDGSAQAALDAARDRWEKRGFDDYGYRVRVSCFCSREYTRPYRVRVRDGRPVTRHRYVRGHNSVPKLFRIVQRAIDDEVDRLSVRYRPRGFPSSIFIDRSMMAADEELGFTVRRLHRRA